MVKRIGSIGGRFAGALALSLFLSGCGEETDFQGVVDASLAFTADTEALASMAALLLDPAFAASTLDDVTAEVAGDVAGRLGTCATATVQGDTVALTFDGCVQPDAPPWGIRELQGEVTATYVLEKDFNPADFVNVAIRGAVTLNGRFLKLNLNGVNGLSRALWDQLPEESTLLLIADAEPPESNTERRTGLIGAHVDYGDAGCAEHEQSPPRLVGADGYLDIGEDLAASIEVESYRRCGGGCPAADGLITTVLTEETVKITFNGTSTASAALSVHEGGATELMDVALGCAP